MLRLIDRLKLEMCPGQPLQVFEFEGPCWQMTATGPHGAAPAPLNFSTTPEPRKIMIAAQSAWVAHTYVHVHMPCMQPTRVTHVGDIWMAPIISELWTPPEWDPEILAEQREEEDSEEPVGDESVG